MADNSPNGESHSHRDGFPECPDHRRTRPPPASPAQRDWTFPALHYNSRYPDDGWDMAESHNHPRHSWSAAYRSNSVRRRRDAPRPDTRGSCRHSREAQDCSCEADLRNREACRCQSCGSARRNCGADRHRCAAALGTRDGTPPSCAQVRPEAQDPPHPGRSAAHNSPDEPCSSSRYRYSSACADQLRSCETAMRDAYRRPAPDKQAWRCNAVQGYAKRP